MVNVVIYFVSKVYQSDIGMSKYFEKKHGFSFPEMGKSYPNKRLAREAIRWPLRAHCSRTLESGLPMETGP
jgi:hypothetical protein